MTSSKARKYTLSCGHHELLNREIGLRALDIVFCTKCKNNRDVVAESHPLDGWHFRCEGDGIKPCRHRRIFGAVPMRAEREALHHASVRGHRVILLLDTDDVEPKVFDYRRALVDGDEPPY